MTLPLAGKVALVTGSDRGIGRATALALARDGADVALGYFEGEAVWSVVSEVHALGRQAIAVWADVTRSEHVQAAVNETLERFGRIDILVPAAGIFPSTRVEDQSEDEWDRVIDTNLKGPFLFARAAIPAMKAQGGGAIVHLSSGTADLPTVGGAAYASTKAALRLFTRVLAGEVAPYGIRVNAVAPGFISTGMNEAMQARRAEVLRQQIVLNRFGTPEEVADVIAFLVSDKARYVTGSTWGVDGGKFAVQVPMDGWEMAGQEF